MCGFGECFGFGLEAMRERHVGREMWKGLVPFEAAWTLESDSDLDYYVDLLDMN